MGVTFDETTQQFVFDFEHDGADDIVSLTGEGPNLQDNPDLTQFIKKAVDNLNRKINLYNYDLVVMPESSSKVNQYMLRYSSTLNEVLRTLRILNEDNDISIFSLIGRKNLMADAN